MFIRQYYILLLFIQKTYQLLRPILIQHFQTNRAVIIKYNPFDYLVDFDIALIHHFDIYVCNYKFILAFIPLSVEQHQITRNGMNKIITMMIHREYFIDCPLIKISYIPHHLIEIYQIQITLEMPITKLICLLLTLQLQHIFYVVQISQWT